MGETLVGCVPCKWQGAWTEKRSEAVHPRCFHQRRDAVSKGDMVAVLVALVLCWTVHTQAQAPRIAACALNCLVPTTPGLHTRAELVGKVTLANRTVQFSASCFDGPSPSLFPAFQVSDGPVTSLDLSVVTSLETGTREVIAQSHCHAEASNGFLTFRCIASEAQGGEVDVLMSIAPLHLKMSSDGSIP